MLVNLFGDYLVKNNYISCDQLADVKSSMAGTRVKLGLIAISEKMLTEKQSEEINRKQAILDKRFGDIAIELGYLTVDQLSHLLDMQGNSYMQFCQTMTDKGLLTLDKIEELLAEYVKSEGFEADAIDILKKDDIDSIVDLFLKDMDEMSKDMASVSFRTINRLITTDINIGKPGKIAEYKAPKMAFQMMNGDYDILLSFTGSDEGLKILADRFAKEEFEKVDLDALDSIAEFINIINGLYATSLSYKKIQVELLAPQMFEVCHVAPLNDLYSIPFNVEGKELNMIIKMNKN